MASRDIPKSFKELAWGWTSNLGDEVTFGRADKIADHPTPNPRKNGAVDGDIIALTDEERDAQRKVQMKNLWPAFISGAGLFSDGYVNNSIGTVTTILKTLYPKEIAKSNAMSNVASIAFVGTVLGQVSFGYISDHYARKGGMLTANVMLILFTVLCSAATWGANGSIQGLLASLTAFRFFLGIAIGAEYPTSSVIASEFANMLPAGRRNRYFAWFTNACIDFGFVVSAFVPLVLLWIFSERHLTAVWRLTLGLGVFPPLALFFMRMKMKNSTSFLNMNMHRVQKFPTLLVVKFYWFRLTVVSLIWFIYDFSAYSFGIFSSLIISEILPGDDLYKSFGWNVVFNLFYMPGAILGALSADYIGPRLTIAIGTSLQAIVGFGMAAGYKTLKNHIAGFVVIYGVFTALGEFGPGDNIGLLAAKTSATPIRGQYYGIAAAIGKIGAFVGTYAFPPIQNRYGIQVPFYISASLCLFSSALALFCCPSVGQNCINKEDEAFVNYLAENGFDITQLGDVDENSEVSSSDEIPDKKDEVNVDSHSKNSL